MTVELSDEEMLRYNRQIVLRGFDFDGQERLKAARVLVVGLGGARLRRRAVSGRRRGRAAHPARFRHCLALQPAAPDAAQRRHPRPAEGGFRPRGAGAH
ncbi:hypothetical protein LNP24_16535 [Klebsiella pneumoniae subsp. pneumoniae]|nr:hypothetical protein [Klebsiella pneumoniae subsp. pneumoniae]